MKACIAAVAAIALAAPVAAQDMTGSQPTRSTGSTPQGSSQPGTDGNGERLTCRRIEQTGNRAAARRVCMTDREWRAYDRSAGER
jgi:hypothetical protein